MTSTADSQLARHIAGALDWWREAGVDCDFTDTPVCWVAPPATESVPLQPPGPALSVEKPVIRIGGSRDGWPTRPEDFAAWWLGEPALDNGQVMHRVPPHGKIGAPLMILVEQPETPDSDRLLSGADGRLVSGILSALNVAEPDCYFASVLPRSMPHPDWAVLRDQGLPEMLLHHLALAAPQRVIAFGANILPLLGHDPAKTPEILLRINPEGSQVPVLAARDLTSLRARPAWKAALWRRLLDWMG